MKDETGDVTKYIMRARVFVRDGAIEGPAPSLTLVSIDV